MLGWFSAAAAWASNSKRCRRSGSRDQYSGRTLIATSRFRATSRARYTSPIPPAPSGATISNASSRVPAASGICGEDYTPHCEIHNIRLPQVRAEFFGANLGRQSFCYPSHGLPQPQLFRTLKVMELHFTPEQEAQLAQIATQEGTDAERIVKDAALRLLEEDARFRAAVREGVAQADRGEFIEEAEMNARLEQMLHS